MTDATQRARAPQDLFEAQRRPLWRLAYRMLGDRAEAEDIVQEAFLRWQQTDVSSLRSPEAWLTTVVTRIAIDHLRSAQMRREVYTGVWLPEPVIERRDWSAPSALEAEEELSVAFLYLLEQLRPEERAAFLLREVLEYSYPQIAAVLEKSEPACRQLVHRAKDRLGQGTPRAGTSVDAQARIVREYVAAVQSQDEQALLALLTNDAKALSDGGGKARAALNPVVGADKVTRFLLGLARKYQGLLRIERAVINSEPGLLVSIPGHFLSAVSFAMEGDRIAGIYQVVNPDKLQGLSMTQP